MRLIFLLLAVCLSFNYTYAQNTAGKADDAGRIAINTFVPEMGEMGPDVVKALQSRLDKIVLQNGVGGSSLNQRFIMTANAIELNSDISPDSPPVYSYELEINLVVGDIVEGTKFSSTSIIRKASDRSKERAYLKAIKSIKPTSKEYQDFIDESKEKIMSYYNSNCDIIIKKATTLGEQKDFDEAIAVLVEVPDVCLDCYNKALDQSTLIFKAKLENECQENISLAKSAIAKNDYDLASDYIGGYTPDLGCYPEIESMLIQIKNHRCAENLGNAKGAWANRNSTKASEYLSMIPTDSECSTEANLLIAEIASKLDADEKKEWDLKVQQQKDDTMLEKANIDRMKAVGVAYGNNQPKTITNYTNVVRGWYGL